jgi:hypothetical protein
MKRVRTKRMMKRILALAVLVAGFATLTAQQYYGYPQAPSVVNPGAGVGAARRLVSDG